MMKPTKNDEADDNAGGDGNAESDSNYNGNNFKYLLNISLNFCGIRSLVTVSFS
ncbi:MAG: hypothetical protein JXR67_06020 [Bacteroidales bacterium]|nr:hypothetical protein [Bacteroidales bacterium]